MSPKPLSLFSDLLEKFDKKTIIFKKNTAYIIPAANGLHNSYIIFFTQNGNLHWKIHFLVSDRQNIFRGSNGPATEGILRETNTDIDQKKLANYIWNTARTYDRLAEQYAIGNFTHNLNCVLCKIKKTD